MSSGGSNLTRLPRERDEMFGFGVLQPAPLDALPHPLWLDDANVEFAVVSLVQVSSIDTERIKREKKTDPDRQ